MQSWEHNYHTEEYYCHDQEMHTTNAKSYRIIVTIMPESRLFQRIQKIVKMLYKCRV